MKPKRGEDCAEMEEPAQDPLYLVKQLVLLIVEARTPDLSAKGRVEGPHCPIIRAGPPHHCSKDKTECFRAEEFCRSAQQLWTHEIPICIDILLFPDCPCGSEEVKVTEGAVTSMADENALLVERWMVVSEKRRHESGLGSNLLLQAVRSYLHFSQISSWLYSEKGKLPNLLAFRIYAPGEESSLDFQTTPDIHAFPYCILRYDSIKVTVSAMKRVSQVPVLLCASESGEQNKPWRRESVVRGELSTTQLCRSKPVNKYEALLGDLKAGRPICDDQNSHCPKEETKAKTNLLKQKLKRRKTSKQNGLHCNNSYDVKDGVLRWNENLSGIFPSNMTYFCEGNNPKRKDETGRDIVYRKEILKEHKNGTEEARVLTLGVKKKSGNRSQEIGNPEVSCGKKDVEKDRRIEQMKFDEAFVEGTGISGLKNSMNKKKPSDTKSKNCLKDLEMDDSFLLMDNPASQKERFWTNFSEEFGDNMGNYEAVHSAYLKSRLEKKMEKSTNAVCNKRPVRKFEKDAQIQTLWEKPRYGMFSADDVNRKSYLAASEAYEEDFICRLSERMALAQTRPLVKSQSAEIKSWPFISELKCQDVKTRTDRDFQKRRGNLDICERQHDTLISARDHSPKSPTITNATNTTVSGQNFQHMKDKEENEVRVECKENNVCNAFKSIQPLSQLTVDISWSDFEVEGDSDDTPTASPNHLSSSRANGSSLCKAVTSRRMIEAVNSSASNLEMEDMRDQKYCGSPVLGQESESVVYDKISPFRSGENEVHGNSYATPSLPNSKLKENIEKDALLFPSQEIDIDEAEVRPKGTSRKIFKENLLPLASYDSQTDSFKMVDFTDQVKVLHSPKVLLSCDVPTEEAISSEKGRCINFEEEVDSELFISRLQEIVPSQALPHSIGSYMSHLAAMSSREESKKEPAAHGNRNMCHGEDKANKLEDIENKLSFIKDSNVFKPSQTKGQADRAIHLVVDRGGDTSDSGKQEEKRKREGEGRMDLEKENIFYLGDCNVENVKEHRNISDNNFGYSKDFTVHEQHSNKCMESEFKKQDTESDMFKNLMESGMSEHKQLGFGIKNETHKGTTSFKDVSKCQSDFIPEPLEPCDTTLSDSDCSDLYFPLTTKDSFPSASSFFPASLSPSLSSSYSSNRTKSISLSSSLFLQSSSPIHFLPSVPSCLTALASGKSHDIENKEWADSKTFIDCGQILLPETPLDDSPQFMSSSSTLDKEKLCSSSSDRDEHSSNIKSSNGKPQLDNPSSSFTTHRLYNYGDKIASNVSALASLSLVDTENQPHSQELTLPRSPTQICCTETKSSEHALISMAGQRDCVTCNSMDQQESGLSSSLNKMVIPSSSLCLESSSEVDNNMTFNDCSSELSSNDTESALKVITSKSSLDSESCSRNSTDVFNDFSPFMDSVLKHPQLSSTSNSKYLTPCERVDMSHNCSDISDIKGSSSSNLNAINTYLQASQSLSFQSSCDNEGRKSSTFHANANINNNMSNDFSSSIGIGFPKTVSSQLEDIGIQQVITKSSLDVNETQTGIGEEEFCKNTNKDNALAASSSPERILKNHSNHKLTPSQADISQFEMIGEDQNLPKLHSIKVVKTANGLPLNNLHRKGTNFTSHTCSSDSDVFYLGGREQCHVDHSFNEDKAKADEISQKEEAFFRTLKCAQSGGSSEDSENTAPDVPKICSTTHSSCLASSLMLSSSSCVLLDTPFTSISAVNTGIGKSSSLSTEAGMDLECSPNHDLDQGSFGRSRISSYGDSLPGWTPNPPHRSVSTPDCAEGEVRGRGYQRSTCSRSTSVLQQSDKDGVNARKAALMSSSMIFNSRTALPTQSSPAPLKRKSGARFDYDASLLNVRAIKNAFSCSKLALGDNKEDENNENNARTLSTSAPASTNCLLGNFEESILNGRIDPVGTVDGFSAEIGASGSFCPKHLHLPVSAFFFALSDDNAPSPYLGHINLSAVSKKGYHIPKKGTVQVTLFNPNKTVVKMFVVMYDLSDMPPSSQTFIRQRTMYIPTDKDSTAPSYLRYLIHLRCSSSRSGKIYLHTDIRLIFARHKLDIDAKTVPYEMKSYTDAPRNPKYSPKK